MTDWNSLPTEVELKILGFFSQDILDQFGAYHNRRQYIEIKRGLGCRNDWDAIPEAPSRFIAGAISAQYVLRSYCDASLVSRLFYIGISTVKGKSLNKLLRVMQAEAYAAVNTLPGEGEHLKLKDYVHICGKFWENSDILAPDGSEVISVWGNLIGKDKAKFIFKLRWWLENNSKRFPAMTIIQDHRVLLRADARDGNGTSLLELLIGSVEIQLRRDQPDGYQFCFDIVRITREYKPKLRMPVGWDSDVWSDLDNDYDYDDTEDADNEDDDEEDEEDVGEPEPGDDTMMTYIKKSLPDTWWVAHWESRYDGRREWLVFTYDLGGLGPRLYKNPKAFLGYIYDPEKTGIDDWIVDCFGKQSQFIKK